jgi:glycosyltransferase involved in cell wall biosynthesis
MDDMPRRVRAIAVVPAGPGGVRDHARLLGEALRERAFDVDVECIDAPPAPHCRAQVRRWLRSLQRGDLVLWHYSVFAHTYRGLPTDLVALGLRARRRGARVCTILHEAAYTNLRQGWRGVVWSITQQAALPVVLRGSDRIVCTSTARAEWITRFPGARRPITMIPVFSNFGPQRMTSSERSSGSRPRRVVIPDWGAERGHENLTAVRGIGSDVELVLLGMPGPGDPRAAAWHRFGEEAAAPAVEFTGVLDAKAYRSTLASARVILLVAPTGPSTRRGTFAASLASGRPVVAITGPETPDELRHTGAFEVVELEQAQEMVLTLAGDEARARALGEHGRAFYERALSVERGAAAFAAELDALDGR